MQFFQSGVRGISESRVSGWFKILSLASPMLFCPLKYLFCVLIFI